MAASFLILSFLSFAIGAPQISFPINSQVPPIARISEAFEFTFASSTFTSNFQPIDYTLSNAPSWLQLEGGSRKLYGTPTNADDVGTFTIKISAQDETGSVEHEATLIVSSEPKLRLQKPLESQLAQMGTTDGRGGFILLPGQAFDFEFAEDTFSPAGRIQRYEAVSSDNTPLPSWINFDQGRLKFSGTTPDLTSLIAPPQSFDITLVASDYPGFTGASAGFSMVIGPHRLHFRDEYFVANATIGSPFSYTIPRDSILLNDKPIVEENITSISINASDWLFFDAKSLTLSGNPPQGADSTKVTVLARDVFGGEAQAIVDVRVMSSPFKSKIRDFNVTSGEKFQYKIDIPQGSIYSDDTEVTVKYEPDAKWIRFDPKEMRLEGEVPKDAVSIKVTLSAKMHSNGATDSQVFNLVVNNNPSKNVKTSVPASIKSSLPSSSSSSSPEEQKTLTEAANRRKTRKTLIIVLATLLPLSVFAGLLVISICITRKNYISAYRNRSPRPTSPSTSEISRPIWPVAAKKPTWGEARQLSGRDESGISGGFVAAVSSDGIVHLAAGAPKKFGPPKFMSPRPSPRLPLQEVKHQNRGAPPPMQKLHTDEEEDEDSQKPVNFSKRISAASRPPARDSVRYTHHLFPKPNARASDLSVRKRISIISNGGTANRRRSSGMGNNRTTGGPPGYGVPKKSWRRNTLSSTNWLGGRESDATFETVSTEIFNQLNQPSVRLVDGSDPAVAQHNHSSYVRGRGSSPFFAGSGGGRWSRIPSLSARHQTEADNDCLMEDVMRAMSEDPSETRTIGPYSGSEPESPFQRYVNGQPLVIPPPKQPNFDVSSMSRLSVDENRMSEGSFVQVVDESGQKVWYPRRERQSEFTTYSQAVSSYYPHEPFEYGVAVTSSWSERPGGGFGYVDKHPAGKVESREAEAEVIRAEKKKAKLVDFTRKRPVSVNKDVVGEGEKSMRNSSYLGDMAFL